MALSPNQKEEAYIQAFIKTLKDLAKNGDQLNGVQLKGVEGMTKWMTQMSNTNTVTKANLKIAKDQNILAKKQQQLDLVKKKMDEVNIRLRHGYKLQEEKEHGEQVRRNIQLRQMHENFAAGFNHLKKALFGGFGFQAAIGTTVKKMAGMTRNFNELQIANTKLKDSNDKVNKATSKSLAAYNMPDWREDKDQKIKHADMELNFAMKEQARSQSGVNTAQDMAKGTQGKMTKPIFEKLGKLGEFLGKKAVPIGIGIGVAGILMSVIVKAFSASPLFAQMMKLMRFMVTLILMPIGTFFGALLRPILIMLLRKFIVPFYSTMMPTLMNLGTQVGNAIVMFLDDPVKYLKDLVFPEEDREFGDPPKNEEELKNMGILDILATWANGWDPNNPLGLDAYADTEGNLKVAIKSGLTDSDGNSIITPDDIDKAAPDADMSKTEDQEPLDVEAELAGGERQPDGSILLPNGDVIVDGVTYKNADNISSSSTNKHTWGGGEGLPEYVNPVTAPEEPTEMTENQKDMQLMMNNPQAWQAKQNQKLQEKRMQEEREKAAKAEADKARNERLAEALAKPAASTGADRMAAQAERNAQQEVQLILLIQDLQVLHQQKNYQAV